MSPTRRVSRREVLRALATLSPLLVGCSARGGVPLALRARVDWESAAVIGREWLAGERSAMTIEMLESALFAGAELASLGRDPRALRRYLRGRLADDFAAGRTAVIGGWVLGLTELRVYALAALMS